MWQNITSVSDGCEVDVWCPVTQIHKAGGGWGSPSISSESLQDSLWVVSSVVWSVAQKQRSKASLIKKKRRQIHRKCSKISSWRTRVGGCFGSRSSPWMRAGTCDSHSTASCAQVSSKPEVLFTVTTVTKVPLCHSARLANHLTLVRPLGGTRSVSH